MLAAFDPLPILPGETLAQLKALGSDERARRKSQAWASRLVHDFPASWASRLVQRWAERYGADARGANLGHLTTCQAIAKAQRAGVPADANDAELCKRADEGARDALRRVEDARARACTAAVLNADRRRALGDDAARVVGDTRAWAALGEWFDALGLAEQWARAEAGARSLQGLIRRACCPHWWRRVLRRLHAQAVESTARTLGLVHKRAGLYVSNETAARRTQQRERNARALESVHAINDSGQAYTLAELAAKGPANREIRRHELMTRIAGFELIAKEHGHEAIFVTVTCPGRMHAMRTAGAGVEPNPRFDGTRPDEAQQYLRRQWARFRAAAERAGLALYGFRIAEPNHDGTPHWHALLFFPPVATPARPLGRGPVSRPSVRVAVRLLRRYFLHATDPGERGARAHRVKVERIDWTRGSAAGYVAKYVAKNIDGYRVEKDLHGQDAMASSLRVDAWAATWRIRQFQQVGGAPVTVWRELRRLHPDQEQESGSAAIVVGLLAVNGAKAAEPELQDGHDVAARETAAHGWASYTALQGGHRVRRDALRLRLLREADGELGRYGELLGPRPVGVVTTHAVREHRPAVGIVPEGVVSRVKTWEVESERSTWLVVPKDSIEAVRIRLQAAGEARRPWSPVNNCTRVDWTAPARLFPPSTVRVQKRRRWASWNRGRPEETPSWNPPTAPPQAAH